MGLGNHLFHARKKKGLSQEEVAEKLGISRQTVSKWETDETLPDICQSKRLAVLYGLSLDELVEFDIDIKEIQEVIDRTSEEVSDKIDWTKAWSKKYPVRSECVPGLKRYSGGCMEGTERVIKPFPEPSPG